MNAPSPTFTSRTIASAPGGDLLGHDARGDQGHVVHGRRHVAERVEPLVGGHEVAGLADDRHADLAHLPDELVLAELDPKPGDRLELVERAARVAEPAAAHLGEGHAAGRDDGADHERRLVAHAAGRVLVDDAAAEPREVDRVAASHHRIRERVRLGRGEAAEEDRHAERGHLVVGHLVPHVGEDELAQLVARELLPVALALDQLGRENASLGGRAAHDSTIGWPGMRRPGAFPPSQAFTVAPTSANSPSWTRPAAFLPSDVGEEEGVLARVVGRSGRRVTAVIGREDQEVAGAQGVEQVGQPPVEVLEAAMEVLRVVPVAPEHVRLDQVREDESVVQRPKQLLGLDDALGVRLGRMRLVDVDAGEDVADLPDAVHLRACLRARASGSSAGAGFSDQSWRFVVRV